MIPTQDIGLPLLLEIDPISPLEASLAGVLGASVAALLDPKCAKRRAKDDDDEVEGGGGGDDDDAADDDDTPAADDDVADEDEEEEEEDDVEEDEDDFEDDDDADEDEETTGGSSGRTRTKVATRTRARPKTTAPARGPRRLTQYVGRFVREVVAELQKVIWPTRRELLTYTAVVVVFVSLLMAIVAGLDVGFAQLVFLVFGRDTNQ